MNKYPFFDNNKEIALLLAFAAIILLSTISLWGVSETSEARYAEISWEMYASGDYVNPTLLGIKHFHKPPVTYWITAFSYQLFGVSVFSARFFLQIALLIQIFLVYKIGIHLYEDKKVGLMAAGIFFSFPTVLASTRGLTTDAYLNTAVLFAVFAWMRYRKNGHTTALYAFYLSLGIGFLIKGPVVFIIPVVFVIGYNLLVKKTAGNNLIHHLMASMLFIVVGFSWFFALIYNNPNLIDYFIFDHTVDRFSTNSFGRAKPFWFYLLILPLTSFPWIFIALKAKFKELKVKFTKAHLTAVWILIPLLFFSISSSKLILYILPVYAGIALGGAQIWSLKSTHHRPWFLVILVFSALITISVLLAPVFDERLLFNFPMYAISAAQIILVIFGLRFYLKKIKIKSTAITFSILFSSSLIVLSAFLFHINAWVIHDQRNVAHYIENLPDVERIYVYNQRLPSLAFQMKSNIISIADGNRSLNRETQFETNTAWKKWLITPNQIKQDDLHNAIIVVKTKDNISYEMQFILQDFRKEYIIDGWIIYTHR